MRRLMILALLCIATGCKTNPPRPPAQPGEVRVDAPFVHIDVPRAN